MPFVLSIVTPERPIVETEVDSVVVPGAEGEFGVLPGHEPLLAPLAAGVVDYTSGSARARYAVSGGFAEVTADRVTLLARTAEHADEIDRVRAEASRGRAEEGLSEGDLSSEEAAVLEAAAARAAARLRTLG